MTLEEFIKTIGKEADTLSPEEIELYYAISVKLFDSYFDKWKKEKVLVVVDQKPRNTI